jgi:hypothetical protein
MNKYRAFFDGMASVSSIYYNERFVPTNSVFFNSLKDRYKKILSNNFEERIIEDIRTDVEMVAEDM